MNTILNLNDIITKCNEAMENCKEMKYWIIDKDDTITESVINEDDTITINIGGKVYQVSQSLLSSIPNTLFTEILNTETIDFNTQQIFFDKSYATFDHILYYYQHNHLNTTEIVLNRDIVNLIHDAIFYNIKPLLPIIKQSFDIFRYGIFIDYDFYQSQGDHSPHFKLEQLSDPSIENGLCLRYYHTLSLTMNREITFDSIDIAAFIPKYNTCYSRSLPKGTLFSSINNKTWIPIGEVPYNRYAIQTVQVAPSTASYIKLQYDQVLFIAYLRIVDITPIVT